MSSILESALAYHALGFPLTRLHSGDKAPKGLRWNAIRSTPQTVKDVQDLFTAGDNNIGLLTGGPGGILAVDQDTKHGKDGPGTWARWKADHSVTDRTRRHGTPSGGAHDLYRLPLGVAVAVPTRINWLPGVDIMAGETCHSNLVLPPSELIGDKGRNGKPQTPGRYTVTEEREVQPIPTVLMRTLLALPKPGTRGTLQTEWTPIDDTDPTWADRIALQRRLMAKERVYLSGESAGLLAGKMRYIAHFQSMGPGLRLPVEVTLQNFTEVYNPRLPEGDRWTEEELMEDVIPRAFACYMTSDKAPRVNGTWENEIQSRAIAEGEPATEIRTAPKASLVQRGEIVLSASRHHENIRDACGLIGDHPDIYQRSGHLVRMVRVAQADAGRVVGMPTIYPVEGPTLKARLTEVTKWVKLIVDKETEKQDTIPTKPPVDVVAAVLSEGHWPGTRVITGITETPLLRSDGTILQEPGYDLSTGYLYEPQDGPFPGVPENPTLEDAQNALLDLVEVFEDFPYVDEAARMVPIAALLTLMARPAIRGSVPAFVFEAPVRGSGKSLQADAVATIATGREAAKCTWPGTDEESEKILGGYARQAVALFAFDNVAATTPFGGAPLDKVLTCGDTVDLRVLGKSEIERHQWRAIILATGNNVSFKVRPPRAMCRGGEAAVAREGSRRSAAHADATPGFAIPPPSLDGGRCP